jgi:hypothetical protein
MSRSIHIVGFKGVSWVSRVIRFITGSEDYSHVAYLSSINDLIECWQHKGNWLGRWEVSKWSAHTKGTPYKVWSLDVTEKQHEKIECFFYTLAWRKTGYDYLGLFRFVGYFIPKLVRHSESKYFCSEGILEGLKRAFEWSEVKPELQSPQDCIELVQAKGGYVIRDGYVK